MNFIDRSSGKIGFVNSQSRNKTFISVLFYFIIFFFILVLFLPFLSGCDKSKTNKEFTTVNFLLDWTPNTNHTGIYAAAALGYYEAEGLKVNIIQPSESSALTLVAGGKADFCVTFQEEIAAALTSDSPLPVSAVATILQHNTSGIISLAENKIVSPADMAGYSYASWDTPMEKAILSALMAKDGSSFDTLNLIPNTAMDVVAALQTDVDLVWIYYGWDGIATELAGLETNFINFAQEDNVLDFYTPILASSNSFLESKPEIARAFLAATAKGYDYTIQNPAAAADILLEAAPELDEELVHASQIWLQDQYQAEAEYWGVMDPSRWDGFMAWMYENNLIKRELEAGQGYTNEFLPQA